jgi:phosphoribosylformylglycinamidine synthase subunit PurL
LLQQKIASLISNKLVQSAHDVSEGGLVVTLLESCFNRNLGIDVTAGDPELRSDAYWFGEAQSRVVVSVRPADLAAFKSMLGDHPYEELGTVTAGSISLGSENWGMISDWKNKYDTAIENIIAGQEANLALQQN